MKRIWILTLFPEFIESFKHLGIVGQSLVGEKKIFDLNIVNIRDYALNKYRSVDDTPFGGGPGMVMQADVLFKALDKGVREVADVEFQDLHVIYTSPRGKLWRRDDCHQLASDYLVQNHCHSKELVFICGRYEGIDERFLEKYVNQFISIGDYILSGGELAVLNILDSALRVVPGVLGNKNSYQQDSFENGLLEYPVYTRPRDFQGMEIPEPLLSGHHKKIKDYQLEQQEQMTKKHRPDLWEKYKERK